MKNFLFSLCVLYFFNVPSNAVKFRKDLKVFMRYNVKVNMFPPDTIFAYADGFRLNWDIAPKKLRRRRGLDASGSCGRRVDESESSPAAGGRNLDTTGRNLNTTGRNLENLANSIVNGRNLDSSETAYGRRFPVEVPNSDNSGDSFSDEVPSWKSSSDGTEDSQGQEVFSKSNFVSGLERLLHMHGWNGSACLERARCEAELLADPHDIVTHLYLTLFRQDSSATDEVTCERNTLPCPVSLLHLMTSWQDITPKIF